MGDGETIKRDAATPERWRRLKELFEAALEREPSSRVSFLAQAAADDPSLADEVLGLLRSDEKANAFLSTPFSPSFDPTGSMSVGANVGRPDSFVGRMLSHYRLEEPLGVGGMGVVYRATDLKLGRAVAIKLLARHLVSDETAKGRFVREARTTSALDHPNIANIYEIGEEDGELFIAMALYEGETVKQRLEKGKLAVEEALDVLRQVSVGLEAAHRAGIVHRDIKPANILMTSSGTVKILDFGLAKLVSDSQAQTMTQAGQAIGTVLYMSPEQLRGEAVDSRSDLWSLGVLAYELLAGVSPFQTDSSAATAMRILHEEPPSLPAVPGVPVWLAELVSQLLRQNPVERPQTASEVLRRLEPTTSTSDRPLKGASVKPDRYVDKGDLLVVDDNRVNRLLVARILEQLGHRVAFAENGRQALEALQHQRVDLVMLDIDMPHMNGYQTLEGLRADPKLRDVPVVMMSSVEEIDSVVRCVELGAEDYLFKPVNAVLLRARVGASLEKKRLRDQQRELFRKFATAEVAEELLGTGLALGGKHLEATVMFSDIRAFSQIAESLSPEETIDLLNSYYTLMFDAIASQGGIVNQIQGDGFMALFGAPLPRVDHRERAVRAGLEMLELIAEFSREQTAQGKPEIRIGIGIASGQVIAGYSGTERRVTYTCVGDTVVIAAHLEAHTKVRGRALLIDEHTRAGLSSTFTVEDHGAVQLKSRVQPVRVYSVAP